MAATPGARGVILHSAITQPSSYRATRHLEQWLKARGIIGSAASTPVRSPASSASTACPMPSSRTSLPANSISTRSRRKRAEWPGLVGMDLVPMVTSGQRFSWTRTAWGMGQGLRRQDGSQLHVVAIDYGIKRNILRQLAAKSCKVTVVPAQTSAEDIVALAPDGVFLSNGPGDPAATGEYAVPVIRDLIDRHPNFRHLPRPPDARHRGRCEDDENAPGPPRPPTIGERYVDGRSRSPP